MVRDRNNRNEKVDLPNHTWEKWLKGQILGSPSRGISIFDIEYVDLTSFDIKFEGLSKYDIERANSFETGDFDSFSCFREFHLCFTFSGHGKFPFYPHPIQFWQFESFRRSPFSCHHTSIPRASTFPSTSPTFPNPQPSFPRPESPPPPPVTIGAA